MTKKLVLMAVISITFLSYTQPPISDGRGDSNPDNGPDNGVGFCGEDAPSYRGTRLPVSPHRKSASLGGPAELAMLQQQERDRKDSGCHSPSSSDEKTVQ